MPDQSADTLGNKLDRIRDWMISNALASHVDDYQQSFSAVCERLSEAGLPVARIHMAIPTLHPLMEAVSLTWKRDSGFEGLRAHEHRARQNSDWQTSPLKALLDSGQTESRHDVTDPAQHSQFPLFQELSDAGMTDYLAFVVPFSSASSASERLDGMLVSWVSDASDGFSDEHLAAIRHLQPYFSVVAKLATKERTAHNIVTAYLGEHTGQEVMNGRIQLGDGQDIRAVIWFCDLRNSTPLAERMLKQDYLDLLNDRGGSVYLNS